MKNSWNLKLNNLFLLIGLCTPFLSSAQFSPSKEIPVFPMAVEEPYLFPINPGKQNWLAGTMGELRNTHFHAGIDIRTNNMAGVPVLATQRGYISRAIVSSYGYGHVLFLTHPDGNVSVYAHLDQYKGKVANHILNKHYELRSFELDVEFAPNQFPVNKGDTIALSGNTGGSSGPHLHFEIRDDKNEALNPLTFKFDEIRDALPPVAQKIALKTIGIDSRINGSSGRIEFHLLRKGSSYFLPYDIQAQGKIAVELLAFDRMDFSQFRCGINEIEMLADSQKIFSQKIDKIDFNKTHDIVSLLNFQTLKTRGLRFNKLYIDDGNQLGYYEQGVNRGEITVSNKPVSIQINLKDTYGNQSSIRFKVKPISPAINSALVPLSKPFEFEINGNILELHVRSCDAKGKINLFEKGTATSLEPSYKGVGHEVYLVDLRKVVPDSATTCQGIVPFYLTDNIPSKIEYTYYSDLIDIHFQPNSLYDTLFLNFSKEQKGKSEIFSIGRATEPLNNPIEITLKQIHYPDQSKMSVYHVEGRSNEFLGGRWEKEKIQFTTNKLGDFVILKDTIPPFIYRIQCHSSSARFRIMDNLSGIASYNATINGEWLLMRYDYKTGVLQSYRLDKTKPLKGDFELKVVDNVGNEKIYKQKIP
jgi:hypothetical protein